MKCIILNLVFFTVFFTCFSSFGQLEKGKIVLRGSFSIHSLKDEDKISDAVSPYTTTRKGTSFSIYPTLGYLISPTQEIGINLEFQKSNSLLYDSNSQSNQRGNYYSVGAIRNNYDLLKQQS